MQGQESCAASGGRDEYLSLQRRGMTQREANDTGHMTVHLPPNLAVLTRGP